MKFKWWFISACTIMVIFVVVLVAVFWKTDKMRTQEWLTDLKINDVEMIGLYSAAGDGTIACEFNKAEKEGVVKILNAAKLLSEGSKELNVVGGPHPNFLLVTKKGKTVDFSLYGGYLYINGKYYLCPWAEEALMYYYEDHVEEVNAHAPKY